MVSGTYVYNVANCELSPFYIVHYEDSNRQKFDFLDDYDYDYFQREPHCKTTSRLGSFGGNIPTITTNSTTVLDFCALLYISFEINLCDFLQYVP